jgi:transposase
VKIAASARKHYLRDNLTDEDVLFAVKHPIKIIQETDSQNKKLYIGVDKNVRMLEVVTVEFIENEEVIIHAMKMTKKYLKYLVGGEI